MCYTPCMNLAWRALLVAAVALLASTPALADSRSLWSDTRNDDDLDVALVTFGNGDEIHQYFGHNALLVEDRARGIGALYNFGMFGFGPGMLAQFLSGRLMFWSGVTQTDATLDGYRRANRSMSLLSLAGLGIAWASERALRIARWGWYCAAGGALIAIALLPGSEQRTLEIVQLIAPISAAFAAIHGSLTKIVPSFATPPKLVVP
jgi:hypothetical protein